MKQENIEMDTGSLDDIAKIINKLLFYAFPAGIKVSDIKKAYAVYFKKKLPISLQISDIILPKNTNSFVIEKTNNDFNKYKLNNNSNNNSSEKYLILNDPKRWSYKQDSEELFKILAKKIQRILSTQYQFGILESTVNYRHKVGLKSKILTKLKLDDRIRGEIFNQNNALEYAIRNEQKIIGYKNPNANGN